MEANIGERFRIVHNCDMVAHVPPSQSMNIGGDITFALLSSWVEVAVRALSDEAKKKWYRDWGAMSGLIFDMRALVYANKVGPSAFLGTCERWWSAKAHISVAVARALQYAHHGVQVLWLDYKNLVYGSTFSRTGINAIICRESDSDRCTVGRAHQSAARVTVQLVLRDPAQPQRHLHVPTVCATRRC